jgi:branched-chain amino acid transport system permease protein
MSAGRKGVSPRRSDGAWRPGAWRSPVGPWAPALVLSALLLPWVIRDAFFLTVILLGLPLAIAVYGLDVVLGRAGQLSLAHAGFFAIGGYSLGLLTTSGTLSFWPALPVAIALTGAVGWVVGLAAFRTRADSFAIFTLAVGVVIRIVIERWEGVTGGTDGLVGIPPPSPLGPISFDSIMAQYYLGLGLLLVTVWLVRGLTRSTFGRALNAVHHGEELAKAVGVDAGRTHRTAFVISALLAGFGGGLYASLIGYIGPGMAGVAMTFMMLVYLMVGGVGTLLGPILGTLLVTFLLQGFQLFESYQMMTLGIVLVLVMIFLPGGLSGGLSRGLDGLGRKLALRRGGRAT